MTKRLLKQARKTQVEESKEALILPRLRAISDAKVTIVFIVGEKNRGKLSSETALRNNGFASQELLGDESGQSEEQERALVASGSSAIAFAPQLGHGLHLEAPRVFWPWFDRLVHKLE